jgi:hypothetical protein
MFRTAVFLAITAAANVAGADCAMVVYKPNVLTPAGANIGDKGGVVVAQLAFTDVPKASAAGWRFRGSATAPAVTAIAPGLDVYAPKTRGGKLVLEDGTTSLVEVSAVGAARALPAPAVASIVSKTFTGRHSSATVTVELAGDPPEGAIALVAFDKDGKPRSFGTVVKNAKQVAIFRQSDCGAPFHGTVISNPGDEIRLAWLDVGGTLSAQTAPVKVR